MIFLLFEYYAKFMANLLYISRFKNKAKIMPLNLAVYKTIYIAPNSDTDKNNL